MRIDVWTLITIREELAGLIDSPDSSLWFGIQVQWIQSKPRPVCSGRAELSKSNFFMVGWQFGVFDLGKMSFGILSRLSSGKKEKSLQNQFFQTIIVFF